MAAESAYPSTMRILVTGANGFVGRALVSSLSGRDDCSVAVLSRYYTESFGESVHQTVSEQPFEELALAQAVRGVDVIIHCAGRAHVMSESTDSALSEYLLVNVEFSRRLARAAVKVGVARLVYLSSVKVNGESTERRGPFHPEDVPDPQDPYGVSKWEAEQALRDELGHECELVVVRPPLIYGPGVKGNLETLQRAIVNKRLLPLGALSNLRSMIGLANLVDFIGCCARHPNASGKVLIPCDQKDVSVKQLAREIASANGVPLRLVPVPAFALRLAGRFLGKTDAVERLCGALQVDHAHTMEWLGWSAPFTPRQCFADMAAGSFGNRASSSGDDRATCHS